MENKLPNNTENKVPNYLKRISNIEKDTKELKTKVEDLKNKLEIILKVLKRK